MKKTSARILFLNERLRTRTNRFQTRMLFPSDAEMFNNIMTKKKLREISNKFLKFTYKWDNLLSWIRYFHLLVLLRNTITMQLMNDFISFMKILRRQIAMK